jgi:hypothetical protein
MKGWLLTLALALCSCSRVVPPAPAASPTGPGGTPIERTRVGNGGDDNALRDNAWFLGAQAIRVCLETEPGASPDLEKSSIEEAFATWREYLSEKRANDPVLFPERVSLPEARHLHADMAWVGCSESPDLRIVVGKTDDARLNWERLGEFSGKSAFVVRREYDTVRGWGRGDMWIASPSRLETKYQTELGRRLWLTGHAIHELGHILGCGHVPDTIMAESFVKVIEAWLNIPPARLQTVEQRQQALWPDQVRELLTCVDCPVEVTRGWTHTQWDAFALLFGTEAIHEVSPGYNIDLSKPGPGRPHEMKFIASTSSWTRQVSIADEKVEQVTRGDLPLFKVTFRANESEALQSFASYQTTIRYSGTLHGRGDKGEDIPFPVVLTRNGSQGALVLGFTDREEPWVKGTRLRPILSEVSK